MTQPLNLSAGTKNALVSGRRETGTGIGGLSLHCEQFAKAGMRILFPRPRQGPGRKVQSAMGVNQLSGGNHGKMAQTIRDFPVICWKGWDWRGSGNID
jgi:hypothetical protein